MSPAAERPPAPRSVRPASGPAGLLPGTVRVHRTGPAELVDRAAIQPEPWPCHVDRFGPRPRGGLWVVDAAAAARLRGCGGGFFPAARKWRAALAGPGRTTVVANAAESEPLSAKDAALLRLRPHLVLDGLAVLAETLEARTSVVWMHGADRDTADIVGAALAEREQAGTPVRLRTVDGGFLAGESSAIRQVLDGGPLLPQFQGSRRSPGATVLVQNVETLARLALVCRAAAWDGRLLTVLTPADRRVVEVPAGTRLGEAVTRAAGRRPAAGSAVLLGGYGGVWARWPDVAGLLVDERSLREHGFTLGAGIVAPLWREACGVAATAAIAGYLARASARQCGPCLFGLPAVAQALAALRDGHLPRRGLRRLADDLTAIHGRGACHHPDGLVRLVRSALDVFADDIAEHLAGRPCRRPQPIPVPGSEPAGLGRP